MKISELINLLQESQKTHGDIDVVCHDYNYDNSQDITNIELITKKIFIDHTTQKPGNKVLNLTTD